MRVRVRVRLAVAAFATITLVFVAQYVYWRMPWDRHEYIPCFITNVPSFTCRIIRRIPIADLLQYGLVLAVLPPFLVALGYWVLAPVRRLVPVIGGIGPQNLGHRVRPGRGNDAVRRLGRALDDMMDRVAGAYNSQRSFAANASHELRTPLAVQRTLIEVGMAEALTPEQQTLLAAQLLATNARNERLIEGLLVLSQADRGLAARTPQSLDRIAADIVTASGPDAADAGVTVTTDLRPHTVAGDGVLLERLVRNLVHNAIRYNHPGGTVHVAVGGRDATLCVRNTGPVVPADAVARLFEPFTRLAHDRIDHSGGSGLGLAIARSIVRAHDGVINPTPADGGGLRVTVRL